MWRSPLGLRIDRHTRCAQSGMFERRVGRLPDFPYLGPYRYFLTFCTNQRSTVFTDPSIVDECVKQFLRAARERAFEITAYCVMPDHVHMLVEGTDDDSDLKAFASLASSTLASRIATSTADVSGRTGTMTTCCATASQRKGSRDTSSRIPFERVWCRRCGTIRSPVHPSTRAKR